MSFADWLAIAILAAIVIGFGVMGVYDRAQRPPQPPMPNPKEDKPYRPGDRR